MDYNKTWDEFSEELDKEVIEKFGKDAILAYTEEYANFISKEIRKWMDEHKEVDFYEGVKQMKVEDI